ncbi:MAG TPA: LysM peptidoglycan-binding domain-containing protein, partial [Pyrinomonadaceae bacterium]|nr:LysM peptidoglycan-binding domain-containing protein [Pyrinomonadaceae bacterium]
GRLRGEGGWLNQNAGNHHRLGFCVAGGLIVEFCFISNKKEIETFMANRREVARAVAQVIIERAGGKTSKDSAQTNHVVHPAETLYSIGKTHNVSVKQLLELNNLTDSEIRVGQVLVVK